MNEHEHCCIEHECHRAVDLVKWGGIRSDLASWSRFKLVGANR
jgi:hypothetical protein